ncbi:hypothetical protein [Sorangium sp. So ce1153]|uniref:hypothetical protein n=1 Tax=Sorangium sp. So ce1153 TaxID=3133333 RepID=UPI003F640E89
MVSNETLVATAGEYTWTKMNGGWVRGSKIGDKYRTYTDGIKQDGLGVLHIVAYDPDAKDLWYAASSSTDFSWSASRLGGDYSGGVNLSLSPSGEPNIVYYASDETVVWMNLVGEREVVFDRPLVYLNNLWIEMAVSSADDVNPSGRPYILFVRKAPDKDEGIQEIVAASRSGAGSWSIVPFDHGDRSSDSCDYLAPVNTICESFLDDFVPLKIVVSAGGDVRFLYAKNRWHYTYAAINCPNQSDVYHCVFQPIKIEPNGEIFIGWITANGGSAYRTVIGDVVANSASVELDSVGRMHVALGNRYVQIGM